MANTGTAISKDGTRIAYEVTGNGPTLVLVAGALGFMNFPYIKAFVAEFAKDYTRVAPRQLPLGRRRP